MEQEKRQHETIGASARTGRHARIAAVIIVVALVIRALMLADFLHANPAAHAPQSDAGVYWSWAGRIAEGQLIDTRPFLSVPLYPYSLALIRTLGSGLTAVYIVQIVLHLATAGMIALLAVRKGDTVVGLVAMGIFLLAEEPAFLATRVLPSTVQLFLIAALLLAADRLCAGRGRIRAASVGLLTGLLALSYPPAMALIPVLFLWMGLRRRSHTDTARSKPVPAENGQSHQRTSSDGRHVTTRTDAAHGFIAAGAACLAILPATLHNWSACGEFIPITAHAGITFYHGNNPAAEGVYASVEGVSHKRDLMHRDTANVFASETGRRGSYRDVDRFFLTRGLSDLAANPAHAFWLMGRKLYWFVSGRHYYDFDQLSLERMDGLLNLMFLSPIRTAWLMGPGLVGLIMLSRARRVHALDLALILLPLVIVIAFFYSPRYRLPALPILSVFAAAAFVEAGRAARRRPRNLRTTGVVLAALCVSVATGPMNQAVGFDRTDKYRPQYECNLGRLYIRLHQYDLALTRFARSNRLQPDQPEVLVGMIHAYTQWNRLDKAGQVCARSVELYPESPLTWLGLATLQLKLEQWPKAEQSLVKCLSLDPISAEAHLGLWWSLAHQGRRDEGIEHLLQSIEIDPSNPLAVSEYGIWLAQQGRPHEAEEQLRMSRRLSPDQAEAHYNLGVVLMDLSRVDEAAACFREALRLSPTYENARRRLDEIQDRRVLRPSG